MICLQKHLTSPLNDLTYILSAPLTSLRPKWEETETSIEKNLQTYL